jgi:hypothetical protein
MANGGELTDILRWVGALNGDPLRSLVGEIHAKFRMRRRCAALQGLCPKPYGFPEASSDQLKCRKLLRSSVARNAFASKTL